MSDEGATIAQAIRDHKPITVSAGSLKMQIGMASFIITNGTDSPPIIGANLVPGPIKEGDSHRCELAGLYGIVHMIEHISCHYEISKGSVHVACNNEQALKVFHPNFLPDPQQANFDFQNAFVCPTQGVTNLLVVRTCQRTPRHQTTTPCPHLPRIPYRLHGQTGTESLVPLCSPPACSVPCTMQHQWGGVAIMEW